MFQKNVAFDLQNDELKSQLQSEMNESILPSTSLVKGCYTIGYVFERVAKREKKETFHNYKITFEHVGDGIESENKEKEDKIKHKIIRIKEGNCYFYKHFQGTGIKYQFNTNLIVE